MRFHYQSGVFIRHHTSSTSRRGGLEVMALLRWSGSESYLRLPKSETLLEVSAVRTYRIRNRKARNNFVGRPVQYGPPRESRSEERRVGKESRASGWVEPGKSKSREH